MINHGYKFIPYFINSDCQGVKKSGIKANGVYNIASKDFPQNWLTVFCDMVVDGGGWIVFQRRIDASVDFYRDWAQYKRGFGSITGNYWIGLENLHLLAAPGRGAVLRVEVRHIEDTDAKHAYYSTFEIGNEVDGYMIKTGGYKGNAGDSLEIQNNMKFTTFDRDNDSDSGKNCAVRYHGAWWYNQCHESNLNSRVPPSPRDDTTYMSWKSLKNKYGGIVYSEMKLRYLA